MENLNIPAAIKPYFNYYLSLYKPEFYANNIYIEIPMKDGSRSLDYYFIKPLLDNGFMWKESFLLGEIYLIKSNA